MYFFKKQREEDKRMKKKVLAFLLASTMIIEPFTVASAADFSDGMGQDTVQFSDDVEDVPEVENDDVDQFGTDAVGEGEESTETHVQIGDKVWVDFDYSTGTATISGTGDMWDYMEDGWDSNSGEKENPFTKLQNPGGNIIIKKIIISDKVTSVGNYFLYGYTKYDDFNSVNISLGSSIKKIGDYAFGGCNIEAIILPDELEELGDYSFDDCGLTEITIPENIKSIGRRCFGNCDSLKNVILPDCLTDIPDEIFLDCDNLEEIDLPSSLKRLGDESFNNCKNLKEIILPSNLKTLGVGAFSNCNSLTEITLPASLKEIKDDGFDISGAFRNCTNLRKVNFEKGFSASIPGMMFENCKLLTEISIPENVSCISSTAFDNCWRLATITINGAKTELFSDAFRGCRNLTKIISYSCSYAKKYYDSLSADQKNQITFKFIKENEHEFSSEKETIKEPTCTEKGIKANKCNICGVIDESSKEELPAYGHKWNNGVITKQATETEEGEIKYTCWRCNETKTESIPKLSAINLQISQEEQYWNGHYQYRFWCTSNKDVTYYAECVGKDSEQPVYDSERQDGEIDVDSGKWITVDIPDEDAVDIYVFATNVNGDHVSVKVTPNYDNRPEKPVYKVGKNVNAFINGDTVIITGTGETYDESWWFDDNVNQNNIKHITVDDGVTSLGSSIFYGFSQVKDVKLPTSLKSIGYGAFEKCDSLKELTIPEGVTNIGNGIINSCTSIKKISLPSTLNTIPRLIDMESTGDMQLDEIVLNDGIKKLGNYAFWNFKNLKNIIIPESVTNIGEFAFSGCTALSNLTLPDSITEIAVGAFSNCVSLGKVTLPKKLTSLGNGAFEYCNAEIIFPASLKYIPIMGANAVTKVTIPEGVKMIGEEAFAYCSNFTEITLPSTITNIERSAFFNTPITEFVYPQNIDNIPASAFGGTKLTEFSVPDNVKEIDDGAFYNCTDLKKITIPEFVTYIGNDVFKNCRNLVIYGKRDSVAERYAYINNIKFVSGQYKVVFKDNGRTVHTYYIDEGGSVLTPPTLKEKPGYTLSWDADYTNIQEDMVINAVWTKKDNGGGNTTIIVSPSETNKYTVTFKDRGEVIKTEKVKSGDAAEYPFITRSGYKLSWDKDFSKVTANITVNAVWTVIKPEKVTSLTAESGKKSIALSWDETEYAGYYLVYRKADSEKEYTQVAKTTKILWTDSKVVPGTQYSYKVVAVRSLSGKKYQGAESDVVTTKIGTPQIGDTYSVGDLNYKLTGTKEVTVTGLAKVTDTLVIPSSVTISGKVYKVTAIQDKAFYRNEDIVNVTIGNNVVNVGKYAFYQCSGLETVKFGKRVAIINTCAFTQCPNLENVTLPSSIRKIGAKAFYQCTSIKVLKINGSALEYVGKKGLAVNKSVTLRLPKKVYTKYKKLIKASGVYSKTKFVKF